MGSYVEINDTLQITKEQGFPKELDFEKHKEELIKAEDFNDRIFEFKDKDAIRFYHMPPVRVFLVENIDGKWLYWGTIHILEINHNYETRKTSGKYKLLKIFTPEEMRKAHVLIDGNPETDFFAN